MQIYVDFDDVLCETARALSDWRANASTATCPTSHRLFRPRRGVLLSEAQVHALLELHTRRSFSFTWLRARQPGGVRSLASLDMKW